jgi:DNA invertase Pin-like site-specific DNA recombinase
VGERNESTCSTPTSRRRAADGEEAAAAGLAAVMAAVERGEVDVLVVFSTSRLSRKLYQSFRFVEEEILDRRKRCVFVKSGIDTDNVDHWRGDAQLNAIVDEMTVTVQASHIRAAHEGSCGWASCSAR